MSVSLMTRVANSVVLGSGMSADVLDQVARQGAAFQADCVRWASAAGNTDRAATLANMGIVPALRAQGVLSLCLSCGATVVTNESCQGEASRVAEQHGYAMGAAYVLECCGTVFLP